MICDDCKKDVSVTHWTHGDWVCDECYYPIKEQMAPVGKVFEPFDLKDGPIYTLNKDKHKVAPDGNSVHIRTSGEYREVLRDMNAHQAEPGEKIGGGKELHTFEGKTRPKKREYSFVKNSGF